MNVICLFCLSAILLLFDLCATRFSERTFISCTIYVHTYNELQILQIWYIYPPNKASMKQVYEVVNGRQNPITARNIRWHNHPNSSFQRLASPIDDDATHDSPIRCFGHWPINPRRIFDPNSRARRRVTLFLSGSKEAYLIILNTR